MVRHCLTILVISLLADFLLLTPSDAYEFPPYKYEGLEMKIKGTVTEIYSDNITFEKEDPEGDFLTTLALTVDIQYDGKRRGLGFTGLINRQIRTKSFDIENSSEDLTLSFRNEFSEYAKINLTNIFTHSQIPGSFEEEFGRIVGRFDSSSNRFNIDYRKDISKHFSVTTGYTNGINWSSREGIRDSYLNTIDFAVDYMPSAATTFSLSYNFATRKYKDGGDISTHSIATGMKRYITKRLFFKGSVGVIRTPSTITNSIGGLLTDEIDKKTNAILSFSRGVQISSDREEFFSNWRIAGSFKRDLLEDLNSSLSVFYGQGKFVSTGVIDRLLGASIALTYVFWEHKRGAELNGNFGYTFSNLDSTAENREYTRNTVSYGLTLGF